MGYRMSTIIEYVKYVNRKQKQNNELNDAVLLNTKGHRPT